MKRRKCCICEGHIVNGRCSECGMPYRSDEELYHLNENRRDHYQHASAAAQRQLRELERPGKNPAKATVGANSGKAKLSFPSGRPSSSYGEARARSSYGSSKAAASYARDTKNSTGYSGSARSKNKKSAVWVAAIILVMVFIELWPKIRGGIESLYDKYGSYINEETTAKALSDGFNDIDIAPKGDFVAAAFEGTFGAGEYIIGQQIPRGIYRIELVDGYGEVDFSLDDNNNGLYEYWVFNHEEKNREDYMIEVLEDCSLLTGGVVRLKGQGELNFICEKAYYQEDWATVDNPLTKEYQLSDTMEAGVDFEPGTYDLIMVEGAESETAIVMVENEGGLTDSYFMNGDTSYGMREYLNLTLQEGARISMDNSGDYRVVLRPSPMIYVKKE